MELVNFLLASYYNTWIKEKIYFFGARLGYKVHMHWTIRHARDLTLVKQETWARRRMIYLSNIRAFAEEDVRQLNALLMYVSLRMLLI